MAQTSFKSSVVLLGCTVHARPFHARMRPSHPTAQTAFAETPWMLLSWSVGLPVMRVNALPLKCVRVPPPPPTMMSLEATLKTPNKSAPGLLVLGDDHA